MYEPEYQRKDQECHSETASEGICTSVSEIAGQRLYAAALETRKKIEEAREKRSVFEP